MPPHPNGTESPRQHRIGEHWSGHNPVPTIHKFLEHLEKDKQDRKAHEQALTAKEKEEHEKEKTRKKEGKTDDREDAVPHRPRKVPKGKTRMVTDPTTGREIEVEDQDEDSMDTVKDPMVWRSVQNNLWFGANDLSSWWFPMQTLEDQR